jgi:dTDP-4-amino-4,6-dideoxygalactose transaminase
MGHASILMSRGPISIEKAINARTKTIIPLHIAGSACDVDRLMEIARPYALRGIEDAVDDASTGTSM